MTVRVFAAASAGGHWEQLMLLAPALAKYEVQYATTDAMLVVLQKTGSAVMLPDCNRNVIWRTFISFYKAFFAIRAFRPDVVVSTGALPGLLCVLAGKMTGARTVWIDSIANSEQLSGCGRVARRFADLCLTQWEHVASKDPRISYVGSLL